MNYFNIFFKICLLVIIVIILVFSYLYNEKFESTDIFYGSEIRLRDFQDVLSITESQKIDTNK